MQCVLYSGGNLYVVTSFILCPIAVYLLCSVTVFVAISKLNYKWHDYSGHCTQGTRRDIDASADVWARKYVKTAKLHCR